MSDDFKRSVPVNELDFNMSTTETVWYSQSIDPDLQAELTKYIPVRDINGNIRRNEQGEPLFTVKDYSSKLKIQTRDNRLSNLDSQGFLETRWYDAFASDLLLLSNLPVSTTHCLMQKDSILNLSQSKRGWFRRVMNTLFQHSKVEGGDGQQRTKIFGGN